MTTTCTDVPIINPEMDGFPVIPDGVNTSTVTDGCVDGSGIYDVFMRAHMDAIHQEYAKQRITGKEYSQVYLGGMQAAMQQGVAFALGKDQAAAQAELARYEILKASYEVALVEKQVCKITAEIALIDEKILTEKAQQDLIVVQTWTEVAKISSTPKETLTLVNGELVAPDGISPDSLYGPQISKGKYDAIVSLRKGYSEEAQHSDTYTEDGLQITTAGVIGKQKDLYTAQTTGFARDAEQKLAKIMSDSYAVRRTTNDTEISPNELANEQIDIVLDWAKKQHGVTGA